MNSFRLATRASVPSWLSHAIGPAMIAVLVAVLAAVAVFTEQLRYRERATVATQNVVKLLSVHVGDVFDKIDIHLRSVAEQYTERFSQSPRHDAARINEFLLQQNAALLGFDSLRVTDGEGIVRYGQNVPAASPVSVADRAFFARLKGDSAQGLAIGGPLLARISGKWVITFARALRTADGRFLGVVYANVPTDHFEKLFSDLELGPGGAVALRTGELALVYRSTPRVDGKAVPSPNIGSTDVSAELRDAVAKSPAGGHYLASTALDGVRRSNAYRKVGDYPFYVIAGLATDDFLQGWRSTTFLFSALAACAIAVAFFAGYNGYRSSQRELRAIRNHFEAIVENSADAIVSKTIGGVVTSWNHGAEEVFGYTAQEMVGHSIERLLPVERRDEEASLLARLQRREKIAPFETMRLRKDGTVVQVSVALSPVDDGRGRIVGVASIARDITSQKTMEAEIRAMAFNDPLTRLPNRRLLMDRLRRAQLASTRQRSWFAVLFIDLDRFKEVNDTFGHEAGDELLVEIANRLQLAVRQNDTVARLGGDEFVLVLEDLGADEPSAAAHVNSVADKVLGAIEQDCLLRGTRHRCSASIGIRLAKGEQGSADQLLKEADAAMYGVKYERRSIAQGVYG